ncbi:MULTISPECIES: DUF998 domain-containing protein [unclassified Mycobacterium]|uniref:DUF998 domain-containing protein n=1 Tax=unclassified Mycobacterium TaxID=2642494 RepID=UPI0029C64655|nr:MULTISPECIES: DUF998 domain-containing protein [unclassified Mycobacterium]
MHRATVALLAAGVVGGLQVMVISCALAATRNGFDIRRHANSQLVLGDWGWVQTMNFVVFGLLLTACGMGIAGATWPQRSGMIAAAGVAVYGLGTGVVVGLNPPDPGFGFPPGARQGSVGFDGLSTSAQIHAVAGLIGFLAMTIACFAFASYFAKAKQTRWAVLSAAVGLAVVAVCAYLAASSTAELDSFNYVPTWVVGAALWLYTSAVASKLLVDVRGRTLG